MYLNCKLLRFIFFMMSNTQILSEDNVLYINQCNTVSGKHPYRVRILYNTKTRATATLDTRFQGSSLNVLKLVCSNLLIGYPLHKHKCYKSPCVHNSLLSSSVLKIIVCACSNANQSCFYILKLSHFRASPHFCLLVSFESTVIL